MLDRLNFTPTLTDDFVYFEKHCDTLPAEAQDVFRCASEFRNSLSAFRLASERTKEQEDGEQAAFHIPASNECEPSSQPIAVFQRVPTSVDLERLSPVTVDTLVDEPPANE